MFLVIKEVNWLELDVNIMDLVPADGFDALLCLGNSFANLLNQKDHHLALENFQKLLKPGGILVIDHRNFDYILEHGKAPIHNIYYNVSKIAR